LGFTPKSTPSTGAVLVVTLQAYVGQNHMLFFISEVLIAVMILLPVLSQDGGLYFFACV